LKERNTVSQVREENSSSQNVNLFITAISERGSSGSGFTVGLSDGSSFFVSKSFFIEYQLEVNCEIGEDLLDKFEIESDYVKALHKAGELLSRAEQSSGGLYIKLIKKGFSQLSCRNAVERVQVLGLLDDERFAELWISSRLRTHPEGKSALFQGLVSRGVNPERAKMALSRCLSEEDLLKAVLKAGKKLSVKYKDSDQKLRQALYRRGFTNREIHHFLDNTEV